MNNIFLTYFRLIFWFVFLLFEIVVSGPSFSFSWFSFNLIFFLCLAFLLFLYLSAYLKSSFDLFPSFIWVFLSPISFYSLPFILLLISNSLSSFLLEFELRRVPFFLPFFLSFLFFFFLSVSLKIFFSTYLTFSNFFLLFLSRLSFIAPFKFPPFRFVSPFSFLRCVSIFLSSFLCFSFCFYSFSTLVKIWLGLLVPLGYKSGLNYAVER